jgi:hypothetical protein
MFNLGIYLQQHPCSRRLFCQIFLKASHARHTTEILNKPTMEESSTLERLFTFRVS